MEHLNHHNETIVPGRAEDGEAGYWSMDLRLLLDTDEVLKFAQTLDEAGYHDHAEQMRETVTDCSFICSVCGTVGNADDLCEMGGECPNEDGGTMSVYVAEVSR